MSLNIKNEETHTLARELAAITGESITGAVTESLRERLERVRRSKRTGMAERLMQIGAECAARLPQKFKNMNPDNLLFDEKGMPK
ncbi:MAG TPA: type II toxin-antitoxin system VapB family antitoxin [Acidobacteriaceae bacterium]|jgi:antitoxin VapB|nr:type II toxin-antitoxin system VapB family antitoxin [Acidobacteriaceae bacterium]